MKTFCIIKPDAISRGLVGAIITRLEEADFQILYLQMRWKNSDWCRKMYGHLTGVVYDAQEEFMTNAPLIGIILDGVGIIERARRIVGATDSTQATPGTIRGDFGSQPIRCNCVHASDNIDSVAKEIELFFNTETDKND